MNPSDFVGAAHAFHGLAIKPRLAIVTAVGVTDGRALAIDLRMFEAHVVERAHAFVVMNLEPVEPRWGRVAEVLRDDLDTRLGLLVRRSA